jgi:hypothetical protein
VSISAFGVAGVGDPGEFVSSTGLGEASYIGRTACRAKGDRFLRKSELVRDTTITACSFRE